MAIDYAVKYSNVIDERFKLQAFTTPIINNDFDFTGVKSVRVYSISTATMGNYAMTGMSRYGTPAELDAPTQEMILTRDRSFTFTIDARNTADTQGALEAGKALQRQLDEVVVPEVDIYRLGKIVATAGTTVTEAVTTSNAYSVFLDATAALTEKKTPTTGRVAFVTPTYYKQIKQDPGFIQASDLAQDMLIKGQLGMIDGIPIVVIPSFYLAEDVAFLITNPIATPAPTKLAEYKIHDNPPGINGKLVEGRMYYDCFVLNNKKDVIYVHKTT